MPHYLFYSSCPVLSSVVLSTRELHVISGTRLTGLIHREHFIYHGGLRVWVQAMNRHGSAKSEEVEFDTANICESDITTTTTNNSNSNKNSNNNNDNNNSGT